LLSETILKLAHEKEFFTRKAIGWVLRDYSHTDPQHATRPLCYDMSGVFGRSLA
jgi:3-methyladenine DNA glycosylase AlkD